MTSHDYDDDIQLPTAVPASPAEAAAQQPEVSTPQPAGRAPDVSATAKLLIKLRDKVFMSRHGDAPPTAETLDAIYRDLARALEAEGVTAVEDSGEFDHDRHQIADTRVTDDPGENNRICGTVRPGYLFDGRLIRSQEVIVYSLGKPAPSDRT